MLALRDDLKIYLNLAVTDMRKSIDGLSVLVMNELNQLPQQGDVFVFYNRAKNKVKCLCWDRNGFIIHYKRLERGRFKFTNLPTDDAVEINQEQLSWLLSGLDFMLMHEFPGNNYTYYF